MSKRKKNEDLEEGVGKKERRKVGKKQVIAILGVLLFLFSIVTQAYLTNRSTRADTPEYEPLDAKKTHEGIDTNGSRQKDAYETDTLWQELELEFDIDLTEWHNDTPYFYHCSAKYIMYINDRWLPCTPREYLHTYKIPCEFNAPVPLEVYNKFNRENVTISIDGVFCAYLRFENMTVRGEECGEASDTCEAEFLGEE